MSSKTMRAAVLCAPRRIEIREVPRPRCGPDDVLVAVERCGICGTDLHIYNGHYAADRLPLILGHEFAGRIAETGSAVTHLEVGQPVIADINIGCGRCFFCRRNEVLSCAEVVQLGIHIDGAFAEFVKVPARLAIPIPESLPLARAALAEPLGCVVRSAKASGLGLAESVLVLGAGPIGNLHVQLARALGAAPIIAVDLDEGRAALARDCGADAVLSDPAGLRALVDAMTEGRGVDLAIESVGHAALYEQALALVRPGGRVAAFGIAPAAARVALSPLDVVLKEIGLKGSVAAMGEDMHQALHLLAYDRIRAEPFLRVTRPLEGLQAAIEDFASSPSLFKVQIAL